MAAPKSYLRYVQREAFGVIASSPGDVLFYPSSKGTLALTASLENVCVWNLRQGLLIAKLSDPNNKAVVTAMALDPAESHIAIGYSDGKVRVFHLAKRELLFVLNAHNAAVTALRYAPDGGVLATGSQDTDIILWDVVAESGLFRLRGHKGDITDLCFLKVSSKFFDPTASITEDGEMKNGMNGTNDDSDSEDDDDTNTGAKRGSKRQSRQTLLLFSASKDSLIKVWDIDQQHCIHTLTGHRAEVWSIDILRRANSSHALLISGSHDRVLRVWRITVEDSQDEHDGFDPNASEHGGVATGVPTGIVFVGALERPAGSKRVNRLRFDDSCGDGKVLMVQSVDRTLDLFNVRSVQERSKRQKRRFKRAKERDARLIAQGDQPGPVPPSYLPSDDFEALLPVRSDVKIISAVLNPDAYRVKHIKPQHPSLPSPPPLISTQLLVCGSDNTLRLWEVPLKAIVASKNEDQATRQEEAKLDTTEVVELGLVSQAGHRSGVRLATMSSDDSLLLTSADNQMKVWNMATRNCIRTIDLVPDNDPSPSVKKGSSRVDDEETKSGADTIQCAIFIPGNRQVIVGTRRGLIDMYDLASGELLWREGAHDGASIWALDMRPDHKGFASGGGHEVWFWEIELRQGGTGTDAAERMKKQLAFSHARTLKVNDEVLCLKHSPDGRYIAVGLLDSTVRVFYDDSLQFFLSLYGHSLPVLSLDISSDSTLIVTGSADKTIKLWGTDFGDCRRSLRAHDNSVMKVRFVPRTHFFFSASKDGMLKFWDGDRHEDILHLEGHHSEIWAMVVASKGQCVVTAGNDKSIRLWAQTDELVFADEERAKRLEQSMDKASRAVADVASSEQIGAAVGGIEKRMFYYQYIYFIYPLYYLYNPISTYHPRLSPYIYYYPPTSYVYLCMPIFDTLPFFSSSYT